MWRKKKKAVSEKPPSGCLTFSPINFLGPRETKRRRNDPKKGRKGQPQPGYFSFLLTPAGPKKRGKGGGALPNLHMIGPGFGPANRLGKKRGKKRPQSSAHLGRRLRTWKGEEKKRGEEEARTCAVLSGDRFRRPEGCKKKKKGKKTRAPPPARCSTP